MGIVRRGWVWLKRFRHRRGYGVHSPFAFDFLTSVVYERGEYYAYRELRRRHPVSARGGGRHALKCRRFLFRLANYVRPAVIRLYGQVDREAQDYLASGCTSAVLCRGGQDCGAAVPAGAPELRIVGRGIPPSEWQVLAAGLSGRSVCLLAGIHETAVARDGWKAVKRLPQVVVTFDLYDYGLLFYDNSKQRQHYIVNF